MKIKNIICLTMILTVGALFSQEPVLFFSFDRNADSDSGTARARGTGNEYATSFQLVEGVSGRALRIGLGEDGKSRQLYHYTIPAPGMDSKQGTICFWVRPLNWDGLDANYHNFTALRGSGRLFIHVYRSNLVFHIINDQLKQQAIITVPVKHWESGKWHHVAAAWNTETMELYIDGVRAGSVASPPFAPKMFRELRLGEHWTGNPGGSALDNLRVFNVKLDSAAIEKEFAEQKSSVIPVVATPGATANVMVENDHYRMVFDGKNGGLREFYAKKLSRHMVVPGTSRALFALRLKPVGFVKTDGVETIDGGRSRLTGQKLTVAGATRTLRQSYSLPGGRGKVELEIAFDATAISRWRISLDNRAGKEIFQVDFPHIAGVAAPDGGEILFRGGAYYLLENPFRFSVLRDKWPLRVPFPILDVYSKKSGGGMYLIDLEKNLQLTELCTVGAGRKIFLSKTVKIDSGASYRSNAEALLGVHSGDWHSAGDVYRDYLSKFKSPFHSPRWLRECDGFYMQGWGPRPRYSDIPFWADMAKRESGMNYIGYWNLCSRWYTPYRAPHLGDYDDLRTALRKIRRNRLFMSYYILGHSIAPSADPEFIPGGKMTGSFKKSAFKAGDFTAPGLVNRYALKKIDGTAGFEWTRLKGPFEFTPEGKQRMFENEGTLVVCPECTEVQQHWIDTARHFFDLGVDGLYWDTVGCQNFLCFDTGHSHGYGGFARGELEWLTRAKEEALKRNPNAIFLSESLIPALPGCSDLYVSSVHAIAAAVRYIAPNELGFLGYANHPKDLVGGILEAFRVGFRMGGYNAWWDKQAPGIVEKNAGLLALRRQIKEFVYPGRFLDDQGVTTDDPTVKAGLFDAKHYRAGVVTLTNRAEKKTVMVTLEAPQFRTMRRAYAVKFPEAEFYPLPFTQCDGKIRFTAPDALASAVVFLQEPEVTLRVEASNGVPGGSATIKVMVRNLSPTAISGQVALELPQGWSGEQPKTFRIDRELGTADVNFTVKVPESAKVERYDLFATVSVGAKRIRAWEYCVIEEPIRVDLRQFRGDLIQATVKNLTSRTQNIRLDILPHASSAFTGAGQKIKLPPQAEDVWYFRIPGLSAAQKPFRVRVKSAIDSPAWSDEFVESFWPLVANGDFELNEFRDDLPDYWWIANPERSPLPKKPWYHWNKSGGFKGRCLMIDGGANHQVMLGAIGPLVPGRTYKLSARVKFSAPASASVECFGMTKHLERDTFCPRTTLTDNSNFSASLPIRPEDPLNQWNEYSTVFTVPPDAKIFSIYKGFANLYLTNLTPGAKAWFDNVRLIPWEPTPEGEK